VNIEKNLITTVAHNESDRAVTDHQGKEVRRQARGQHTMYESQGLNDRI
jgi:hypothetical protein